MKKRILRTISVVAFISLFHVQYSSAGSFLVDEARRFLGGNPTGWSHDWCAHFLNTLTGHRGDAAISYASWGRPSPVVPGAVIVYAHHVAVVTQVLGSGRVVAISGNDGHRVRERPRSLRGVVAVRAP